jgi:hypothetical protein
MIGVSNFFSIKNRDWHIAEGKFLSILCKSIFGTYENLRQRAQPSARAAFVPEPFSNARKHIFKFLNYFSYK